MKTQIRLLIAALTILSAQAQTNVYSLDVIGYVNHTFGVGDSLFSNPLARSPANTLSSLFANSTVPDGTVVSLWNSASKTFDTSSTYGSGAWSINFTLNPGTGAKLTTSMAFLNTFVGNVQSHNGGPFADPLTPAPVYSGPNGLFLLSDKAPVSSSTGNDIFQNILGRAPNLGEQVLTLTTTSTYLGGGNWDNPPSMAVGGAVFLNVGPVVVPEPTAAGFAVLGFAVLHGIRRRRN